MVEGSVDKGKEGSSSREEGHSSDGEKRSECVVQELRGYKGSQQGGFRTCGGVQRWP